jgi:hypothetical protein
VRKGFEQQDGLRGPKSLSSVVVRRSDDVATSTTALDTKYEGK